MATACDSYAPFDAGAGSNVTEDGWRAMMRRSSISGVMRNVLSESAAVGDSTGLQVKINPGEYWIEGHWGQVATARYQPVATPHASQVRTDLVVVRANFVANTLETDVLTNGVTGTTIPPALTRNTSMWEIPLATVTVPAAAVTITAANVLDARQWGGPPVGTVTDDFLQWGDKISTTSRWAINKDGNHQNTFTYWVRMHSLGEQTCSTIRLCPTVLPIAGTVTARIFRGFRPDQLATFIDPTTSTFVYGGTAGNVHSSAIPTTTFRAGETIAVAVAIAGTSTAPAFAMSSSTTTSGLNLVNFINPSTTTSMVCGFKSSAMPTTLNLLDGTWTRNDSTFWAALA